VLTHPPLSTCCTVVQSSVQTVYTVNSNGVSMQIQDGSYCGAIGASREMTLTFGQTTLSITVIATAT
jgi:hypothetical protein